MSGALQVFCKGTAELLSFIKGIELERRLLAATSSHPPLSESERIAEEIRVNSGTGSMKKQLDYTTVIVTLYGLFEQLVEGLIGEYSSNLSKSAPSYADLPSKLKKAHSEMSVELLPRLEHSRYRGRIQIGQVIANMHSCLSGNQEYMLNLDALQQHSANFRSEVLGQAFQRLGIEQVLQKLPKYEPFSSYLDTNAGLQAGVSTKPEIIYGQLDDLADRRNDVAHGVNTEILSIDILRERIDYLTALGNSLACLIEEESVCFHASFKGQPLGKPIQVYNHEVVCVELNNQGIKRGDQLVMIDCEWPNSCIYGPIVEIQVNNIKLEYVPPSASIQVGCRVGFRARKSSRYILVPQA
jgi:hypothetical protein